MRRVMLLAGIGMGAALMYALDPQQGNRRRALARDKVTKAVHRTGRAVRATSRDVAHRAEGLAATLHSRFFDVDAPDEVVEARVRARLGRVSSHPGAIQVAAHEGTIALSGPVLTREIGTVLSAVTAVRGVKRVDNRLVSHDGAEHVPALQGGAARAVKAEAREWSPTTRLLIGAAGSVLATAGLVRRDKIGMLLGGVGIALVARAASDVRFDRLATVLGNRLEGAETKGIPIPVRFGPAPGSPSRGPRPFGTTSDRIH